MNARIVNATADIGRFHNSTIAFELRGELSKGMMPSLEISCPEIVTCVSSILAEQIQLSSHTPYHPVDILKYGKCVEYVIKPSDNTTNTHV